MANEIEGSSEQELIEEPTVESIQYRKNQTTKIYQQELIREDKE